MLPHIGEDRTLLVGTPLAPPQPAVVVPSSHPTLGTTNTVAAQLIMPTRGSLQPTDAPTVASIRKTVAAAQPVVCPREQYAGPENGGPPKAVKVPSYLLPRVEVTTTKATSAASRSQLEIQQKSSGPGVGESPTTPTTATMKVPTSTAVKVVTSERRVTSKSRPSGKESDTDRLHPVKAAVAAAQARAHRQQQRAPGPASVSTKPSSLISASTDAPELSRGRAWVVFASDDNQRRCGEVP